MPKMSRDKGSRFERQIANALSEKWKRTIRRVPLSGGLDIKCDIYDPTNDDFPFFIECKNRESYRWSMLFDPFSELYSVFLSTCVKARDSYLSSKYVLGPEPLFIFKGGDFREAMVMYRTTSTRMQDLPPFHGQAGATVPASCRRFGYCKLVAALSFNTTIEQLAITTFECFLLNHETTPMLRRELIRGNRLRAKFNLDHEEERDGD